MKLKKYWGGYLLPVVFLRLDTITIAIDYLQETSYFYQFVALNSTIEKDGLCLPF